MSTPPRRRRPNDPNGKPEGGTWLPTIALGLGVVVAGLGIGALVAVLMQRNSANLLPPVAVRTDSPVPSPRPARVPVVIATMQPPRTPRPSPSVGEPSPEPTLEASPAPSAEPSAPPSPSASAEAALPPSPSASRKPSPLPEVKPSAALSVKPSPRIAANVGSTAKPASQTVAASSPAAVESPAGPAASTPAPVASPSLEPVATASPSQSRSTYEEHASGIVRRYLEALIRGDEKTAYGALGSAGGALSERAFLDPGARIVSIKVTRLDASNASVGCEISSAKGHYYATYHVAAASDGPYIAEHDYIKV